MAELPSDTPRRWPWERLGNDGLTRRQRRFFARRWRQGAGALPTEAEVKRLREKFQTVASEQVTQPDRKGSSDG